MTSLLFAVSIDTLLWLVPPQISSPMRYAPKMSSIKRFGRDDYSVASQTNHLYTSLSTIGVAIDSSGGGVSSTCAPVVPTVLLSLSSDV